MLALGFTNFVFLASISYIILEQKKDSYKSGRLWLLLLGLFLSLYITAHYLMIPVAAGSGGLMP